MGSFFVHDTALVEHGATVGEKSKIWHFSHVMPRVKIGEGCNIGQNVFIANDVSLGDNVKVQNNVSIYTGVNCEDDVFLGPSMVFTNVINPRSGVNRKETKHVPDYALVIGSPAKIVGWMSEYGVRLAFDNNGEALCESSGEKYALVKGEVKKL